MARSIFRLLLLALSLMALCAAQADTVTFPDDLVAIEQGAFMNDASITEVTIPEGCTRIGGYAFSNCAALETVTIPSTVEVIEPHAFDGCANVVIRCEPGSPAAEYADRYGLMWHDGETLHNRPLVVAGRVFKVLSDELVEGARVELHRGYKRYDLFPTVVQSADYEETPLSACVSEADGFYALTIPAADRADWGDGAYYTLVAEKDGWETQFIAVLTREFDEEGVAEVHIPFACEGDTYHITGIARDGSELYFENSKYYDSWKHPVYTRFDASVRYWQSGAYGTPNYGDIFPYTRVNLYYNDTLIRSWYCAAKSASYWHVFKVLNGELYSINKQTEDNYFDISENENWYRLLPGWMSP